MQKLAGVFARFIGISLMLALCCAAQAQQQTNNSPAAPSATQSAQNSPQTTSQTTPQTDSSQSILQQDSTQPAAVTLTSKTTAVTKPGSASQLANLIGSLALIILLIFGLSWFVKRFSQGGFMQNPTMKIVSSMPLGTRERLMLVEVGGKQLLLGVTATQINNLHVFDEPVVGLQDKAAPSSEFSQKLMAILQKNNDSAHKNSQG